MVSIGKRIQNAINYMEKSEYDSAVSDVCIALDATAKKYYSVKMLK